MLADAPYDILLPHYVAWRRTVLLHKVQKYKYSRTKVQILTHKSTNTDALPCKAVWTDASRAVGAVDLTGNPKPWHPESLGIRVDPIDKGNYWPLFLEWSVACFTCVTSTQVLAC